MFGTRVREHADGEDEGRTPQIRLFPALFMCLQVNEEYGLRKGILDLRIWSLARVDVEMAKVVGEGADSRR